MMSNATRIDKVTPVVPHEVLMGRYSAKTEVSCPPGSSLFPVGLTSLPNKAVITMTNKPEITKRSKPVRNSHWCFFKYLKTARDFLKADSEIFFFSSFSKIKIPEY